MTHPTVVVGAGVVGLAVARALARRGADVVVVDAADRVGAGVTSRNSEVIHAGLYYPPDSLKAQTCIRGRDLLYAYAADRGVAHRRVGKLIVATTEDQIPTLRRLRTNAERSGVPPLPWLAPEEVQAREPEVRCVAGLWSEHSGIIDSHGLTEALAADVTDAGGTIVLRSPVRQIRVASGLQVDIDGHELRCDQVVLAAGLGSLPLARTCIDPAHLPPAPTRWAKGNYFGLVGPPPFRHLVYPVPEPGGLGIHATVDLAGRVRFGPDVQWVRSIDPTVDEARAPHFYQAIRRYWPALPDDALMPAYAGIRPKITAPGEPAADFRVLGPADHGVSGLVTLLGIESPGLTAALALAEEVTRVLEARTGSPLDAS